MTGPDRTVLCLILLVCLGAPPIDAQQLRVTGTTSLRYVDVRPLATDSVRVEDTRGDGILRRSVDGDVVRCVAGDPFCRFVGSKDPVATVPMIQDLEVSVWGLGRGIRAYGRLRGRASAGDGGDLWPRSDDPFDVLAAYVELDRRLFRFRAGRQWRSSGLGYHNYDGASVLVRPLEKVTVELFGGRSLIRGANEVRTGGALQAVEPFAPDEDDLLIGGQTTWRPGPVGFVSLLYQREIRRDRTGLFAERVALDGEFRAGSWRTSGALEVDLALRAVNDARLEGELRLGGGLGSGMFVRRYRPFFEAWTIWGAFDPVGFYEVGGRVWWRPVDAPVTAEVRSAWRRYSESNASGTFGTYRDTGWRITAAGTWVPAVRWNVQGRLGTDVGFGAASHDASLRVERRLGEDAWVGASSLVFERLFEFRVTEGTVFGFGADGGMSVGARTTVRGDLMAYLHSTGSDLPEPDWSQIRGSLTVRWIVGPEPGLPGGGDG